MRKNEKLKNIQEANKRLLSENDGDLTQQVMDLTKRVYELESLVKKLSDTKDKNVLVYCNTGNTATRAMKLLKKAGYEKINNLAGGIAAWKEANLPLARK